MVVNFKGLLKDVRFLEMYGRLMGDGWLSIYKYDNGKRIKNQYVIGFSGHLSEDMKLAKDTQEIFKILFNRKGYLKLKPQYNCLELWFGHKELLFFLNEFLNFPIGKKKDLKISDRIEKKAKFIKPIIRGVFDTDGSFFLDKNFGYIYPQIEIHMKAPLLLDQIEFFLKKEGFRLTRRPNRIRLKGIKQIQKWMEEIGSSNPKHILRYQNWLNKYGPVAQPG